MIYAIFGYSRIAFVLCMLCLTSACGPSAEERQAEALLAEAQKLSLVGGKFQARHEAHEHAEKLFKDLLSRYPKTKAAESAKAGLARMPEIHQADRKIAQEELAETYQKAIGDVLNAAQPRH